VKRMASNDFARGAATAAIAGAIKKIDSL